MLIFSASLLLMILALLETMPISSSGHIFLLRTYFCIDVPRSVVDYSEALSLMCVLVALSIFFISRWGRLIYYFPRSRKLVVRLLIFGFITESVTVIVYGAMLMYVQPWYRVSFGFLCTAVFLFFMRFDKSLLRTSIWYKRAVWLGLAQGIATLPGISRLALTLCCAVHLGYSQRHAYEVSWLIVWPLHAVLSLYTLRLYGFSMLRDYIFVSILTVAMVYCFLTFVYCLVLQKRLWIFGIYTLVLSFLLLI